MPMALSENRTGSRAPAVLLPPVTLTHAQGVHLEALAPLWSPRADRLEDIYPNQQLRPPPPLPLALSASGELRKHCINTLPFPGFSPRKTAR